MHAGHPPNRIRSLVVAIFFCIPYLIAGCEDRKSIQSTKSFEGSSANTSAGQSVAGPSSTAPASSQFEYRSVGSELGIDFRYQNGESAWLTAMIESNGGGVGWIDFDRDGRWDLFLPGGGLLTQERKPIMVANGLFKQTPGDRFESIADRARVDQGVCYSFGAAVSDYDSDGFPDIFISGYGGQQLLRNMGDGTFEDWTQIAGFEHRGWSSSAAWLDLDNDGDLDLYIAHYGVWTPETDKRCLNNQGEVDRCAPADYVGESDELWINQGDGSFANASEFLQAFQYRGIGVIACDFDHDGDTDLYVANDEDPNTLFDNQGSGTLKEIGAQSGTNLGSRSIVDGSMGLALGDFDGNRKPDILVTNYQNEYCELYLNQGNQYFSLGTRSAGLMALGQAVVGWGTAFGDYDLDGDEDLIVIAGHTSRKPIKSSNLQKPYLLENRDRKRLISIGETRGDFFRQVHAGRGMAIADFDNDGDLDFAVSMLEQPVELLRNDLTRRGTSNPGLGQTSNANADAEGNYLLIDLIGRRANRDAIGSWVEVEWGGETRIKHRYGGGSYASTHASTLHIGLGKATSQAAAKVTVHWVGGKVETFADIRPNQRVILLESSE